MSGEFEKYAVYWVPKRTDALARFGVSWSGWCADQGEFRRRGTFGELPFDVEAVTSQVRRNGFHAVIKAPFALGAGRSRFVLEHALGAVAEGNVSFQLPRLRLAMVNGCVALAPYEDCGELDDLLARTGAALSPLETAAPDDGFAEAPARALTAAPGPGRADTGPADSVVRFPATATRLFHVPLTDPLDPELASEVMQALHPLLAPMLDEPRQLHDVALMADPGEGRPLRLLQRYDLRGWPLRDASRAMPCHGPHVLMANLDDPLTKSEIAI